MSDAAHDSMASTTSTTQTSTPHQNSTPALSAGSQSFDSASSSLQPATPPPSTKLRTTTGGPIALTDQQRARYNKYGSLGRASAAGRVPLHRRGTSGKYEALEDLLREAGYKETRIFTPELDRSAKIDEDALGADGGNAKSILRGRVGAVVGFFAGLVTAKSEVNEAADQIQDTATCSPPASPSPQTSRPTQHRQYSSSASSLHQQSESAQQALTYQLSSSVESLPHSNPASRPHSTYGRQRSSHPYVSGSSHGYASTSSLRLVNVQETIPESPSSSSRRNSYISAPRPHGEYAQVKSQAPLPPNLSRAGSLLRHIASESNLPPERPQSTPPSSSRHSAFPPFQSNAHGGVVANEAKHSWLQSVARTMLRGVPSPSDPSQQNRLGEQLSHSDNNAYHQHRLTRTVSNQSHRRPQRTSVSHVPPPQLRTRTAHPSMPWNSTSNLATPRNSQFHPPLHRASSALSRSSRPDTASNALLAPPSLVRFGVERSPHSEGEVSRARVLVRSAPGSRATSRVRGERGPRKHDDTCTDLESSGFLSESAFKQVLSGPSKGKGRESGGSKGSKKKEKKGKGKDLDGVDLPVLARTRIEGDVWDLTRKGNDSRKTMQAMRGGLVNADASRGQTSKGRDRCDSESTILVRRGRDRAKEARDNNRYLSGWGMQLPSPSPSPERSPSASPHRSSSSRSSASIHGSSSSSTRQRNFHSSYSATDEEGRSPRFDDDKFSDGSISDASDSSDDAEIDLARLLVPAKRQNSIRSLRRHLVVHAQVPPHTLHGRLAPFHTDEIQSSRGLSTSIRGLGLVRTDSEEFGGRSTNDSARRVGKWDSAPPSASAQRESSDRRLRSTGPSSRGSEDSQAWAGTATRGEGEDEAVARLSGFGSTAHDGGEANGKRRAELPRAWAGWGKSN